MHLADPVTQKRYKPSRMNYSAALLRHIKPISIALPQHGAARSKCRVIRTIL